MAVYAHTLWNKPYLIGGACGWHAGGLRFNPFASPVSSHMEGYVKAWIAAL